MASFRSAQIYVHNLSGRRKYALGLAAAAALYVGGYCHGQHHTLERVQHGTLEWNEINGDTLQDLGLYHNGEALTGFQNLGTHFAGVEWLFEVRKDRLEEQKDSLERRIEDIE